MPERGTVLIVGIGLQGRATVFDLLRSGSLRVVAADADPQAASAQLDALDLRPQGLEPVDVLNPGAMATLIRRSGADVAVCMVPPELQQPVAQGALAAGVPFVSTSYTRQLGQLHDQARERGLALLPEMGLDPGIDLLLCRAALDELDEVHGLLSFGGGIPAPECATDPLRYKISWSFPGVLEAYRRSARLRRRGRDLRIPGQEIFQPQQRRTIRMSELGELEGTPNGDALAYIARFGLQGAALQDMARFTLRWPGHGEAWRLLSKLGLLEGQADDAGSPIAFLARHLEPRLQYGEDEADLVALRAQAWGLRQGAPHQVCWDLLDRRDAKTGLFAMNRSVGFTASIAAQLLLDGTICGTGLLSPARDVPCEPVFQALRERGMRISRSLAPQGSKGEDRGSAP